MKIYDRSGKKLRIGSHVICITELNVKTQDGRYNNLLGTIFIVYDVIKSKLRKDICVLLSSTEDSREQVTISKNSLVCFSKLTKDKK